jgi:hypothetical protein
MVKYLSFHNSSFALKYFKKCKWQGHSVTHPLVYICQVVLQLREIFLLLFFFFFCFLFYIICCCCFSSLIWYLQRNTWLMMANKNLCRLSWSGLAVVLGSWTVLSLTSEIAFAALVWRAEQFPRERERERERERDFSRACSWAENHRLGKQQLAR